MPLVLNQATDLYTGRPTGRDHLGRAVEQQLDQTLDRLERATSRLVTNATRPAEDDNMRLQRVLASLDEEEPTGNANLIKLFDIDGASHIIDRDDVGRVYLLNGKVHVVFKSGPLSTLDLDRGEAARVGLAVDEPRNPSQPLESNMNSALPLPTMDHYQQPPKGHAEMEYEPCVNCADDDLLALPVMNARFVPTEPQARFASYGGRSDDLGDVLPLPTMTY